MDLRQDCTSCSMCFSDSSISWKPSYRVWAIDFDPPSGPLKQNGSRSCREMTSRNIGWWWSGQNSRRAGTSFRRATGAFFSLSAETDCNPCSSPVGQIKSELIDAHFLSAHLDLCFPKGREVSFHTHLFTVTNDLFTVWTPSITWCKY